MTSFSAEDKLNHMKPAMAADLAPAARQKAIDAIMAVELNEANAGDASHVEAAGWAAAQTIWLVLG